MRIVRLAAMVVLAFAPAVGADAADDKFTKALEAAMAADGRGETMKAAALYGEAVAITHAAEDIEAEQKAADALVTFADAVSRRLAANAGKKPPDPTLGTVLAAVLAKLDPARPGAYVSAPVLARNLLCLATEEGEFRGVADVAKVTAAHRTKAGSGRAAPVVAKYGDGLTSVGAGAFEAGGATLDAVTAEAVKGHWLDLAAHAGTEAAAAWVRAGKPEKAVATVTAVATAIEAGDSPSRRSQDWSRFAAKRLADAPAPVRKPLEDLVAKSAGQGDQSSGGSAAGGSPTARGASTVARMLSHLAKGRPFVSVQCSAKGWTVGWMTKKSEPESAAFDSSGKCVDEGGITLALSDRSVALRAIDYAGTAGQIGDGRPSIARAFYLIDEGETWSVASDGVVSITAKK